MLYLFILWIFSIIIKKYYDPIRDRLFPLTLQVDLRASPSSGAKIFTAFLNYDWSNIDITRHSCVPPPEKIPDSCVSETIVCLIRSGAVADNRERLNRSQRRSTTSHTSSAYSGLGNPTIGSEIPPSDIDCSLITAIGKDPKLACGGSQSEDDSDTRGFSQSGAERYRAINNKTPP